MTENTDSLLRQEIERLGNEVVRLKKTIENWQWSDSYKLMPDEEVVRLKKEREALVGPTIELLESLDRNWPATQDRVFNGLRNWMRQELARLRKSVE
jgi:hypothetical protein